MKAPTLLLFAAGIAWATVNSECLGAELSEPPITDFDREHWSFRPVVRPEVPAANPNPALRTPHSALRTPIDAFILAKLAENDLRPMPEADKLTLLRRVTSDLTGLRPTTEEIADFLADERPDAYERLVDRLLASPAYGERWAQHWLDLARFAETDGFEHDHVRPNAWRYRDWVIEAFNSDMPYDEFVRLQLAGDELRPGDPSAAVATGFLLCGADMPDINSQDERRHNFLNDMTATVGSVFLALQIGCAQCHDHKYDPVSQADFYRLRAIFSNAELFGEHPIPTPEQRAERERFEAERNQRWTELEQAIESLQDVVLERVRADAEDPDLRLRRSELQDHFTDDERKRHEELTAELDRVKKQEPPPFPMGRITRETSAEAEPSYLYLRGDWQRKGPELQPAYLRIANPSAAKMPQPDTASKTTGRRTALAEWLTRPDHPLTARVMVNRLWQRHFGRGLSETSSDFGLMGEEPKHLELLDWLATGFIGSAECGVRNAELNRKTPRSGNPHSWSLKRMHRLIVTSATYRQCSNAECGMRNAELKTETPRSDNPQSAIRNPYSADPDNRLFWRMNRRRLDGEAIRDAMLAASEGLNRRRGGPGVRPPLPEELLVTLLKNQWPVTPDAEDHRRRSIYLFVRRNLPYPLFAVFDRPDTNQSCPKRNRSTTAPQALTLLNSELSLSAAKDLAGVLVEQAGDDIDRQIELAYLRTLSRPPNAEERALARQFLLDGADRLRNADRDRSSLALPESLPENADVHHTAALVDFCLALFNLNEFIYVD